MMTVALKNTLTSILTGMLILSTIFSPVAQAFEDPPAHISPLKLLGAPIEDDHLEQEEPSFLEKWWNKITETVGPIVAGHTDWKDHEDDVTKIVDSLNAQYVLKLMGAYVNYSRSSLEVIHKNLDPVLWVLKNPGTLKNGLNPKEAAEKLAQIEASDLPRAKHIIESIVNVAPRTGEPEVPRILKIDLNDKFEAGRRSVKEGHYPYVRLTKENMRSAEDSELDPRVARARKTFLTPVEVDWEAKGPPAGFLPSKEDRIQMIEIYAGLLMKFITAKLFLNSGENIVEWAAQYDLQINMASFAFLKGTSLSQATRFTKAQQGLKSNADPLFIRSVEERNPVDQSIVSIGIAPEQIISLQTIVAANTPTEDALFSVVMTIAIKLFARNLARVRLLKGEKPDREGFKQVFEHLPLTRKIFASGISYDDFYKEMVEEPLDEAFTLAALQAAPVHNKDRPNELIELHLDFEKIQRILTGTLDPSSLEGSASEDPKYKEELENYNKTFELWSESDKTSGLGFLTRELSDEMLAFLASYYPNNVTASDVDKQEFYRDLEIAERSYLRENLVTALHSYPVGLGEAVNKILENPDSESAELERMSWQLREVYSLARSGAVFSGIAYYIQRKLELPSDSPLQNFIPVEVRDALGGFRTTYKNRLPKSMVQNWLQAILDKGVVNTYQQRRKDLMDELIATSYNLVDVDEKNDEEIALELQVLDDFFNETFQKHAGLALPESILKARQALTALPDLATARVRFFEILKRWLKDNFEGASLPIGVDGQLKTEDFLDFIQNSAEDAAKIKGLKDVREKTAKMRRLIREAYGFYYLGLAYGFDQDLESLKGLSKEIPLFNVSHKQIGTISIHDRYREFARHYFYQQQHLTKAQIEGDEEDGIKLYQEIVKVFPKDFNSDDVREYERRGGKIIDLQLDEVEKNLLSLIDELGQATSFADLQKNMGQNLLTSKMMNELVKGFPGLKEVLAKVRNEKYFPSLLNQSYVSISEILMPFFFLALGGFIFRLGSNVLGRKVASEAAFFGKNALTSLNWGTRMLGNLFSDFSNSFFRIMNYGIMGVYFGISLGELAWSSYEYETKLKPEYEASKRFFFYELSGQSIQSSVETEEAYQHVLSVRKKLLFRWLTEPLFFALYAGLPMLVRTNLFKPKDMQNAGPIAPWTARQISVMNSRMNSSLETLYLSPQELEKVMNSYVAGRIPVSRESFLRTFLDRWAKSYTKTNPEKESQFIEAVDEIMDAYRYFARERMASYQTNMSSFRFFQGEHTTLQNMEQILARIKADHGTSSWEYQLMKIQFDKLNTEFEGVQRTLRRTVGTGESRVSSESGLGVIRKNLWSNSVEAPKADAPLSREAQGILELRLKEIEQMLHDGFRR